MTMKTIILKQVLDQNVADATTAANNMSLPGFTDWFLSRFVDELPPEQATMDVVSPVLSEFYTRVKVPVDARFENRGSIWLLRPLTQAARDWMDEHCPADGEHQYFGSALVVESRYVASIYDSTCADGLTVSGI
jgi:hypothetical protein